MTSIPLPARTPIALVEDNAALRDELVFHLQCAGYAATGLPHGAALQAHLAHQPCCLVVLDVGLPGEDGLSICATLRAQRPELGVVLLTARGAARDRLNGLHEGADAYLVKPRRMLPGTAMSFGGLKKDSDRHDLIAFLSGLKP